MRRFDLFMPIALAASGCTLLPGLMQTGPCTADKVVPAQFFAVQAPATASAQVPFKITAWIRLPDGGGGYSSKVGNDAVKVDQDTAGKTLTVTGRFTRTEPAPGSSCAFPAIYQPVQAWLTETDATLPAGRYEIRIAPDAFISDRPDMVAGEPFGSGVQSPQPQASTSITIE